ncbi:hypothetical protein JCM6882_009718 [Rhodosporidiobolus microsporus]
MASNSDGHCCVCGTSTNQRCSACGTAGFDLFFCSREHQKLVYFAHKKVCGANAKPFLLPRLSKDEATTAKEILYRPLPSTSGTERTLAQLMVEVCDGRCTPELIPVRCLSSAIFDVLTEGDSHLQPQDAADMSSLIAMIRKTLLVSRQVDALKDADPHGALDPVACLELLRPIPVLCAFASTIASALFESTGRPDFWPMEEDWYISLLHQTLVYASVRYVATRNRLAAMADATTTATVDSFRQALQPASAPLFSILEATRLRDPAVGSALEYALKILVPRDETDLPATTAPHSAL